MIFIAEYISRISRCFDTLTHSQKTVASYIMDNLDQVAFDTLEELAKHVGVSTTTIIRFSRTLGYSGYSEMQKAIQTGLKNKASLPERLKRAAHTPKDHLLNESFTNDMKNIQETLSMLSEGSLQKTVDSIIEAKNVYVLGMRSSYSLAYYMASRLGQVKNNVRLINSAGMTFPEEIVSAGAGDICVAYFFPRYSKTSASMLSWFKRNKVRIVLITSLNSKPMKEYGDIILPCAVSGVSFKNSYAAPFCLTNYLINAVSIQDYDNAKKMLERTEEILSKGYYLGL